MVHGQSQKGSLLEAILNAVGGYGIAVLAQAAFLPFFGCSMSISKNMEVGILFTFVSIARSYIFRRIFNHISSKESNL